MILKQISLAQRKHEIEMMNMSSKKSRCKKKKEHLTIQTLGMLVIVLLVHMAF